MQAGNTYAYISSSRSNFSKINSDNTKSHSRLWQGNPKQTNTCTYARWYTYIHDWLGPGGLLGALEGISYLFVVGLVGWSVFTKVKTGSGLPAGPGGVCEHVCMFAVSACVRGIYICTYAGVLGAAECFRSWFTNTNTHIYIHIHICIYVYV